MGSDSCRSIPSTRPRHFNPRFPHGERRLRHALVCDIREFQSTLPAWGATFCQPIYEAWLTISIHAPRVGSDRRLLLPTRRCAFQSTLPAWGATTTNTIFSVSFKNFNPRSPRGERRICCVIRTAPDISIHAPRVGSDLSSFAVVVASTVFQSTLPAWGATRRLTARPSATAFQSTLPAWGAT